MPQAAHLAEPRSALLDRLAQITGSEQIVTSLAERVFFSTDIASQGETAEAVVRVDSAAKLAQVVELCTREGVTVIPRGGGFSYTGGYTPIVERTVIVDMRPLDQIVEINEENLYVRVQTGCTWRNLYEALKARGLRTPYYGPMSGYRATIGGALSQGSLFLGSTEFGTAADSVLSLEVVLADGSIIHTGSDSRPGTAPFFRSYGPDLTGLFLSDTGALGFKTMATLKLIRWPKHQSYGSFAFEDGQRAMAAMSDIGRAGIATEAYCWDPYFVDVMSRASTGMKQDLQFLLAVMRNSTGPVGALSAGARIALAGKSVFKIGSHIIQVVADDHSRAGAAERMKTIRKIALRHGAKSLAPSVPMALRATPFTDFNVEERRTPIRNLPINGLFPHSQAQPALKAIRALFAEHADDLSRHGIEIGTIFFAVGRNAMTIEPLLHWKDMQHFQHNRITQTSDLDAIAQSGPRPEATEFALALREKLKKVMDENGAVHVQIGKSYDYLPSREPRVAQLVRDIKAALDPLNLINPGSLGLGK